MSDSLTLSDCTGYIDAGEQVPFETLQVTAALTYTHAYFANTVTMTFNGTLTATRVPYDPDTPLGDFEFWVVRGPCSPFAQIIGGPWQINLTDALNTTDTSGPCDRDEDAYLKLGFVIVSGTPLQAYLYAQVDLNGTNICFTPDSVLGALDGETDLFDLNPVTLEELGDGHTVTVDTPDPGPYSGGSVTYTFG